MIHPTAIVHESAQVSPTADVGPFCVIGARVVIGARTTVWSHVNMLAEVFVAADCSIGAGSEIGRGTTIDVKSRIGSQVFLPPRSRIGRWVFIGPGVRCADDQTPRVPAPGDPAYKAEPPIIEDGASVGLGVILLPGVRIGASARVAAGALVTKDVPAGGKVRGHDTAAKPFVPSEVARQGGW